MYNIGAGSEEFSPMDWDKYTNLFMFNIINRYIIYI